MRGPLSLTLCVALSALACSEPAEEPIHPQVEPERIAVHVDRLRTFEAADAGSDNLHGARPGGTGESDAVAYLISAFGDLGLAVEQQSVPLARITPTPGEVRVTGEDIDLELEPGIDHFIWTRRHETQSVAEGELLFVGYGISAPGLQWDDYEGVDARGRIVVMLSGDPRSGQRHVLGALGQYYYGGRTYKFEEAARRGAAGALVIDLDESRSVAWQRAAQDPPAVLGAGDGHEPTAYPAVEGWLLASTARRLFDQALAPPEAPDDTDAGPLLAPAASYTLGASSTPTGFDDLLRLAGESNFRAVPIPLRVRLKVDSQFEDITSTNVIATLAGTHEEPSYVLVSSQWNDLPAGGPTGAQLTDADPGHHPPGVGVMLETARALVAEPQPHRSIVFVVVTALPEGLIGLSHFLHNPSIAHTPSFAIEHIDAAVHMAEFNAHAGESGVVFIGPSHGILKDLVRQEAAKQFRGTSADTDTERLFFYGPTESHFTELTIPSLFVASRSVDESLAASDPGQDADFTTAALDTRMLFHVVLRAANAQYWPVR